MEYLFIRKDGSEFTKELETVSETVFVLSELEDNTEMMTTYIKSNENGQFIYRQITDGTVQSREKILETT